MPPAAPASTSMKTRLHKITLLAVVAWLPAILRADHEAFVVINVNASKAYTEHKMANGSPRPETYIFYKGNFFPGTPDLSMSRMTFDDIAKVLAPNLAKQNYLPAKDPRAADLLIVVNWGTTMTDPSTDKNGAELQTEYDNLMGSVSAYNSAWNGYMSGGTGPTGLPPDPSDITSNLMVGQASQFSATSYAAVNARLLGYTEAITKEADKSWAFSSGLNSAAETHLSELNQERYFVIVLAYDYQKILREHSLAVSGHGKPAQPAPLWTLRMNVQADGNNFTQALPAMSQAAADYFGKRLDGLQTAQVSVGSRGNVDIGETKFLGVTK